MATASANSPSQYNQLTDPFNQYNDSQAQPSQAISSFWNVQVKTPLSQVLNAGQFFPTTQAPPGAATLIYTSMAYTEMREVLVSIPAGLVGAVLFFIAPANASPSDYVAFNFQFEGTGQAGVPQFQQLSFQTGLEPGSRLFIGVVGTALVTTPATAINYRISGVVVSR